MELTTNQQEVAIRLRNEFLRESCPDMTGISAKGWAGYVDLSRAVALILDATETLPGPLKFREALNMAWRAYVKLYNAQHDRVLLQVLGNDEKLVSRIRDHVNGQQIIHRIMSRVKEEHGAISSTVDASSTEVIDILVEEMDDWLDEM